MKNINEQLNYGADENFSLWIKINLGYLAITINEMLNPEGKKILSPL